VSLVRLVRLNFGFLNFGGANSQTLANIFLLLIRVRFAFDPLLIRCWFGVGSIWRVDLQGRFVSVRFWFDFEPGGGMRIFWTGFLGLVVGGSILTMMLVYMVGPIFLGRKGDASPRWRMEVAVGLGSKVVRIKPATRFRWLGVWISRAEKSKLLAVTSLQWPLERH
jgi:hypothetical protein